MNHIRKTFNSPFIRQKTYASNQSVLKYCLNTIHIGKLIIFEVSWEMLDCYVFKMPYCLSWSSKIVRNLAKHENYKKKLPMWRFNVIWRSKSKQSANRTADHWLSNEPELGFILMQFNASSCSHNFTKTDS